MASPQAENGHVDIANEIVDALCRIRISGEEMQCLWVIFRKTYGWKKKEDWIALSQFVDMTGLKKPNIIRAINKLLDKNIIIKKDNSRGVSYGFQKNYKTWKPLSKKITLSKKIKTVIKKDNLPLSKKIPTKDTITKDTITKEVWLEKFVIFYSGYPKKKSKGYAEKVWIKLKPSAELFESIITGLESAKISAAWTKEDGQYIPHPSSWLNAKGWEDEIIEAKDCEIKIGDEVRAVTQTEFDKYRKERDANGRR